MAKGKQFGMWAGEGSTMIVLQGKDVPSQPPDGYAEYQDQQRYQNSEDDQHGVEDNSRWPGPAGFDR